MTSSSHSHKIYIYPSKYIQKSVYFCSNHFGTSAIVNFHYIITSYNIIIFNGNPPPPPPPTQNLGVVTPQPLRLTHMAESPSAPGFKPFRALFHSAHHQRHLHWERTKPV